MNKDLLIARLLNAADKLLLHAVPLADWDGDRLPEKSYEDYPAGIDNVEEALNWVTSRSRDTTYIVPAALLDEIASIVCNLDGTDPQK